MCWSVAPASAGWDDVGGNDSVCMRMLLGGYTWFRSEKTHHDLDGREFIADVWIGRQIQGETLDDGIEQVGKLIGIACHYLTGLLPLANQRSDVVLDALAILDSPAYERRRKAIPPVGRGR